MMPLYEVTADGLRQRPPAGFAALEMYERQDLQRLLRDDIAALGEDLLVVGEEFGDWQDARRRIDLLALDKAGRLVVIEIKRTDDGGHMELQAIRYAAPLVDDASGKTYVLTKMWGRTTETKLRALSDAFPEAKVSFRAAASSSHS